MNQKKLNVWKSLIVEKVIRWNFIRVNPFEVWNYFNLSSGAQTPSPISSKSEFKYIEILYVKMDNQTSIELLPGEFSGDNIIVNIDNC